IGIAPPAALANGPSAGDNQYTDPLAGQTTTTTHTPTSTQTTPPPTSTSPSPSSGSSSAAPAATPATSSSTSTTAATTSTTSATSTSTAAGDPQQTLPMTGFDAAIAAALGALLLGAGVLIRRRVLG